MKNKEKMLKNALLFIILIIITYVLIFKNYSFKDTMALIAKVNHKFIILAFVAMFLKLLIESINIRYVLSVLNEKISILKSLKYTIIGFFYSGITPAASGGQPMQIYYMSKEGIPATKSTIALLLELCSYHVVTLIIGLIGTIINYKLLNGVVWVFIISLILNIIATVVLFVGLYSKRLSTKLVNLFVKLLAIFKYNKIDKVKENIDSSLKTYHISADFIKKEKGIFLKSTIIVFFQVMMFYTISYFIYRSFDLNSYSYLELVLINAMLLIATSSIPLPGTVGVSESAFLSIYALIFGITILPSAMLLNRFINFYLFMIVSFIVVIVNTIKLNKKVHN